MWGQLEDFVDLWGAGSMAVTVPMVEWKQPHSEEGPEYVRSGKDHHVLGSLRQLETMSYINHSLKRGISTAVSLSRGSPDSAYTPRQQEARDTPSPLCHEDIQAPWVSRRKSRGKQKLQETLDLKRI